MSSLKENNEAEDETLNNLEIYIDCIKDITEEFKKNSNPSFSVREEVNSILFI